MAIALAVGIALRFLNHRYFPNMPHFPGMLLFAPAAASTVFLAWRSNPTTREVAASLTVFLTGFVAWNVVLLWREPLFWDALTGNLWHWSLFAASGFGAAKFLHWTFGPIITHGDWQQARGAERSSQLTIKRILVVVALLAGALVMYRAIILPSRSRNVAFLEWYQLFPDSQRIYASAILGGFLYAVHWMVTVLALRLRSYRLASVIIWIPFLFCLRIACDSVYFSDLQNTTFSSYELEDLAEKDNRSAPSQRPTLSIETDSSILGFENRSSFAKVLAEAVFQVLLTLVSIFCLRKANYHFTVRFLEKRGTALPH